jgi:hypothetical protein
MNVFCNKIKKQPNKTTEKMRKNLLTFLKWMKNESFEMRITLRLCNETNKQINNKHKNKQTNKPSKQRNILFSNGWKTNVLKCGSIRGLADFGWTSYTDVAILLSEINK